MTTREPDRIEVAAELLRAAKAEGAGAVELVALLRQRLGELPTMVFIGSFRQAFGIPLKVLLEAETWQGFHQPGPLNLTDEQFTRLLSPWI
ncbi:hypothetical protein N8J89_14180 [Crossiella sp. CA-258035]|uniref:hypothetical protein n=1 Tax=Crossiella sp. CA-258035 TaxID=2981138 RepID=UPI0024BC71A1|nr:hypothetical protein [Crossiella sp. CA-258035]WHT22164.1 hypothetical protein N8J89_14180 [Crossiella sp. CA-258035]